MNIHLSIKEKINYFIKEKKIPHIVFHGPSGSGKRTILEYLISHIYKNDSKKNVMYINCAHGKGIRFIRDELKFFAKTNIQHKNGKIFKSVILFNADKLTTDAQSALRRCIEQFSHTTRFFIVIDEHRKLLKPIVSRFCNIHVPLPNIEGKRISLHDYNKKHFDNLILTNISKRKNWLFKNIEKKGNYKNALSCMNFTDKIFEKGYSGVDLMETVEKNKSIDDVKRFELLIHFDNIRREFRNEKLLMFYILTFAFMRPDSNLENIKEM